MELINNPLILEEMIHVEDCHASIIGTINISNMY